jgi:uncharacterized membrane protein
MTQSNSSTDESWSDRNIEQMVGNLLRAGVLTAAVVVAVGAVAYLARYGGQCPDYRTFHGEPSDLRSVPLIIQNAVSLRGSGVIQVGLLLLIATPVLRVVFAAFAFGRQRDYLYLAVSLVVLALLCLSLAGLTS